MPELENKIRLIEQEIAGLSDDFEKITKLAKELEKLKADLEEKEMRWLELTE